MFCFVKEADSDGNCIILSLPALLLECRQDGWGSGSRFGSCSDSETGREEEQQPGTLMAMNVLTRPELLTFGCLAYLVGATDTFAVYPGLRSPEGDLETRILGQVVNVGGDARKPWDGVEN